MKYPYIFLDLDNTILDFQRSSVFGFEKALTRLEPDSDWKAVYETFLSVSHRLWRDFEKGKIQRDFLRIERFRQICSHHHLSADPLELSQSYLDLICKNSFFIDGAEELCRSLSKNGHKIVAVTNGLEDVQKRRLETTGLVNDFKALICSNESYRPKPFPDLFAAAHKFLGSPAKSSCLMVGDNVICDVLGAKKFGLRSCWFNPQMEASPPDIVPHYEVPRLEKLYEIVG